MADEENWVPGIEEEPSSSGGSAPKARGKIPQWAVWTIVAVSIVVVIGIAVGVTLALTMGGEGNEEPVISTLTAVPPVVSPGGYSIVTCVASDPEGSPVTYSWTATGGTISGIGNIVSWIAPSVAGTFTVGVDVSDGEGGTAEGSVTVAVSGATPTATPTHTSTPTSTPTPTPTSIPTPTSTVTLYGSISINTTPSGAAIYIDGVENSNVTPSTIIHVPSGSHSVRLVSTGYWREENVQVYGGQTTYINWVLYTVHDEVFNAAGRDAYVNKSEPDTNYDISTLSVAGNSTRIFAGFNLGSIPDTAVILSADLSLYYYDNESISKSGAVGAYRVTGNWDETIITWNTMPSAQSTSIATITVPAAATGDFLTWSISSLVQGWVDGSMTNYGLMLRDTNETSVEGYKLFRSSEWGTPAECPKLEVSYYDPAE